MKKQSLLAQKLKDVIKLSGKSQKAFAETLGVSEQALSQWLHDGALIPPEYIEGIVDTARQCDGTKSAITALYKIAELPAKQVTPFRKVGRDINSYLTRYRIAEIQKRALAKTCTKKLARNEKLCRKLAEFVHITF